jgi:hypothetical protein
MYRQCQYRWHTSTPARNVLEREVVALSGSRRTESLWQWTSVFDPNQPSFPIATMLLNLATLKDSYAPYVQEYRQLYS